MHFQPAVALTAALFWGNESTFDADLQAAFRAKGNFYPSSRPPAAREPIHLADPADSHEVPMEPFFFLLLFFFRRWDGFLSCLESLVKKHFSSQVVRTLI